MSFVILIFLRSFSPPKRMNSFRIMPPNGNLCAGLNEVFADLFFSWVFLVWVFEGEFGVFCLFGVVWGFGVFFFFCGGRRSI